MSNEIPPTQKGQLDALLASLGVTDFNAAQAALTTLRSTETAAAGWHTQQQAIFAALGGSGDVPEHYDFAAGIAGLRANLTALHTALGVTDQAEAVTALGNLTSQVNSLRATQTTIFAALGATDHAGAMRAINDINGRIEAGVQAGLITRAASAGLPAPVAKVADPANLNPGGAKTCTRAEFDSMNPQQRLEFSNAGGKIVAE